MSINPIKNLMQDIGSITPDEIAYQISNSTLEQWCKSLRDDMNKCLIHFPIKHGDWIPRDKELPELSRIATDSYLGDFPDTVMEISEPVTVTFLGFNTKRPITSTQAAVLADDGDWYWYEEDEMVEVRVTITAWKPLDNPYRGCTI